MKKCPYCAEDILDEAIFCRFCNHPLPGHESEVPAAVKPGKSKTPLYITGGLVLVAIIAIAAVLLSGGLAVRVLPTPTVTPVPTAATCYEQARDYVTQVDALMAQWDDTMDIAGSTPRMSLAPIIADLQELKRTASEMVPPSCAGVAHDHLLLYMDYGIDAYLAFLANESDSVVSTKFKTASTQLENFVNAYLQIKTPPTP